MERQARGRFRRREPGIPLAGRGACLAAPDSASPLLLAHVFEAAAKWSREAWGTPHHFIPLASALLARGEETAVLPFACGFIASFDTYAACHQIAIAPDLLSRLQHYTGQALADTNDTEQTKLLEAARELFTKLQGGNAAQGWVTVKPGTPVTRVKVVFPRWYHKVWAKVAASWKRGSS